VLEKKDVWSVGLEAINTKHFQFLSSLYSVLNIVFLFNTNFNQTIIGVFPTVPPQTPGKYHKAEHINGPKNSHRVP